VEKIGATMADESLPGITEEEYKEWAMLKKSQSPQPSEEDMEGLTPEEKKEFIELSTNRPQPNIPDALSPEEKKEMAMLESELGTSKTTKGITEQELVPEEVKKVDIGTSFEEKQKAGVLEGPGFLESIMDRVTKSPEEKNKLKEQLKKVVTPKGYKEEGPVTNKLQAILAHSGDQFFSEFRDELAASVMSNVEKALGDERPKEEIYQEYLTRERSISKLTAEEHPKTAMTARLATGVGEAVMQGKILKGAAPLLSKVPKGFTNLAKSTVVRGLASGAVYGAGMSEADIQTETKQFLHDTSKGAILGTLIPFGIVGSKATTKGAIGVIKSSAKAIKNMPVNSVLKAIGIDSAPKFNKLRKALGDTDGSLIKKFINRVLQLKNAAGEKIIAAGDSVDDIAMKSRELINEMRGKISHHIDSMSVDANGKPVAITKGYIASIFENSRKVVKKYAGADDPDHKAVAKQVEKRIELMTDKYLDGDSVLTLRKLQNHKVAVNKAMKAYDKDSLEASAFRDYEKSLSFAIDSMAMKINGKMGNALRVAKAKFSTIARYIDTVEGAAAPVKSSKITRLMSDMLVTRRALAAAGIGGLVGSVAGPGGAIAGGLTAAALSAVSRRSASIAARIGDKKLMKSISNHILAEIEEIQNSPMVKLRFNPKVLRSIKGKPSAIIAIHLAYMRTSPKYREAFKGSLADTFSDATATAMVGETGQKKPKVKE
jgi:hypothetical protein